MNKLNLGMATAGIGALAGAAYATFNTLKTTVPATVLCSMLSEKCRHVLSDRVLNQTAQYFSPSYCSLNDTSCTLERLNAQDLTSFCRNPCEEIVDDILDVTERLLLTVALSAVIISLATYHFYTQRSLEKQNRNQTTSSVPTLTSRAPTPEEQAKPINDEIIQAIRSKFPKGTGLKEEQWLQTFTTELKEKNLSQELQQACTALFEERLKAVLSGKIETL